MVHPLPADQILNVNVPDLPLDQIKGIRVTRLGNRHRAESVICSEDPRGQPIYWIGPPGSQQDAGEGTDFAAIEQGYVSITPDHRYDCLQQSGGAGGLVGPAGMKV